MAGFISRRLLVLIPIWIVLSVVSFSLLHLAGGSPAAVILGPEASPASVHQLSAQLGLNQPLPSQYFTWIGGVLHGDFGRSYFLNAGVGGIILSHFGVTLQIAVCGFLIALAVSLVAGTLSATRPGGLVDGMFTTLSLLGFSVPEFVLGLFLVLALAVAYPVLPVQGYVGFGSSPAAWLSHITLPAFTVGLIQAGPLTRIVRVALRRTLGEDYIRTARAHGLSRFRIVFVHALRPALLSILTAAGLVVATLLGGVFITEMVFHLPGLGELLLNSALNRDFPTLEAGILFVGTVVLVVNLAVDVLYAVADPRIRRA